MPRHSESMLRHIALEFLAGMLLMPRHDKTMLRHVFLLCQNLLLLIPNCLFFDLFCLRTSKKLSVGELIRAIFAYILYLYTQYFVLFIINFGHFYVCYWFSGDVQGRRSRNKQLGVKRSKFGQSKKTCRNMVSSCRGMRSISAKNPRAICCGMLSLCRDMPRSV